jgi:hypothetical protein
MSHQGSTIQSGQQFGQQPTTQQWSGQQQGAQFPGRLSSQQRGALTNVAQAIEVCSWCADQCVQEADPNMIECIRLCEDVAELGEATLTLLSRNSRYGQSVAQSFQQAVQACAQECGRHPHSHCQECSQTLRQTATAVQSLVQQPRQMTTQ